MASLPKITINDINGGIVRPQISSDGISGALLLVPNLTNAAFSNYQTINSRTLCKQYFSYEAFKTDFSGVAFEDEVQATAAYSVSGAATAGATLRLQGTSGALNGVDFGTYTFTAADAVSATTTKNAIFNYLNNILVNSGFTATFPDGAITAPRSTSSKLFGDLINGLTLTKSGTFASSFTIAAFSGGVADVHTLNSYNVSEYFRTSGGGKLWVGVVVGTAFTSDFSEIEDLQTAANGEIRQLLILDIATRAAYATAITRVYDYLNVVQIQTKCNTLTSSKKPLSVLYAPNLKGVTLTTLANLQTLNSPNVSVVIGQDGANVGSKLSNILGISFPAGGAMLGVLSTFRVSDSIAWVGKLQAIPFATAELDTPAFTNFELTNTKNNAELESIADKNYIFLKKFDGLVGSFISDSLTATLKTSDFFSIERVRTKDKVRRLANASLIPLLASPLDLDPSGLLTTGQRAVIKARLDAELSVMQNLQELSAYSIDIDPTQNVLSTDLLKIVIRLLPKGVARFIQIDLQFTTSI